METVLVGLDGPPAPTEALRGAADYCRLNGDELVGGLAYRPSQSEFPPDWYEGERARVRKRAEARWTPSRPPFLTDCTFATVTHGT